MCTYIADSFSIATGESRIWRPTLDVTDIQTVVRKLRSFDSRCVAKGDLRRSLILSDVVDGFAMMKKNRLEFVISVPRRMLQGISPVILSMKRI